MATTQRLLILFDRINELRINIILNYFLMASFFVFRTGSDVSPEDRLIFAVIATALVGFSYLFNRYTDYHYDIVVDGTAIKFQKSTYLVLAFLFLAVAGILVWRHQEYIGVFVIGLVFGIPYSVRTILRQPFKNYLFLKTAYSSGSKAAIIFYWLQYFTPLTLPYSIALTFVFFCSHSVFGILWDVRDIEADRVGGVRTIPNVYGVGTALWTAAAFNIVGFLVDLLFFGVSTRDLAFFGSAGVLIILTEFFRHPRFFHTMIWWNLVARLLFVNDRELSILIGAVRVWL